MLINLLITFIVVLVMAVLVVGGFYLTLFLPGWVFAAAFIGLIFYIIYTMVEDIRNG